MRVGLAVGQVLAGVSAGVMACGCCLAQAGWTVRPEWVRAHEEFLASDVMAGRGSATRDEEIAATYVASEFMGYGLKPAPGMSGYLQSARVVAPELDGHALLQAAAGSAGAGASIEEGAAMMLVRSSGEGVSGPVVRVEPSAAGAVRVERGSVLVMAGEDKAAQDALLKGARKAGAAMVVLERGAYTDAMFSRAGGKTRVAMRLKEEKAQPGLTVVALSADALGRLLAGAPGKVTLAVQVKPEVERRTFNAIGYLPGTDATSGTLLLTAHLDHLGVGQAVHGDAIFNGANDDASGTTAVLELAHALAAGPRLKRSVLFVCYGSEEAGELGSEYFGRHSPVPLKELVANLEFEMIGAQDPKMPKDTLMLTGWERSNLGPMLRDHGARVGPDPWPEQNYFQRSDNYQLALKGVVAHTASGWGATPTYHQPNDDLDHLDFELVTTVIQSLVEPVRWLAESSFKPEWVPGGRPVR